MIHVLHIFSGDLWAGAEAMIYHLLRALREYNDVRITALCLNEGPVAQKLRKAGINIEVIPEEENSFIGILKKTKQVMKGKRFDIIHCHRYKENLLGLMLAGSLGSKNLVTTMHGLTESPTAEQPQTFLTRCKSGMNHFLLKRYFNKVVAVSEEMKGVLVNSFGYQDQKIDVIHNGIAFDLGQRSSRSRNNGRFHIGTVGRMVSVKDYELFLEVAAEIRRQLKTVRFSILGDGPQKEKLFQKVKDLDLAEHVEFLDSTIDPFPYYRSLDLFLNTSMHEGIPMSILEAMACAVPIVAPKVGGIPEIIDNGRTGLLVEKRDARELADACLTMIRDESLRNGMVKEARDGVESKFSSTKMAEDYQDLYESLSSSRFR